MRGDLSGRKLRYGKTRAGRLRCLLGCRGVDAESLDPVFLDFANGRAAQKRKYRGEFFPAQMPEGASGKLFVEFFRTDKETGRPKGIVAIRLRNWKS